MTQSPPHPKAPAGHLRPAEARDIAAMFDLRARTADNPISASRLAELGITPHTVWQQMQSPSYRAWVWDEQEQIQAFCAADADQGEVLVLAVLAGHEGRGLGRALLQEALHFLQSASPHKPWLMAGQDPQLRSHGFYRRLGWRSTGRIDGHGDEELVYAGPPLPSLQKSP